MRNPQLATRPRARTAQGNGGEVPVLLYRLRLSPWICRRQDAIRFQLALFWSTISKSLILND